MAAVGQGLIVEYIKVTATNATVTGSAIIVDADYTYSYQWEMGGAGTPVGSISVEVNNVNDGNWSWVTLPGTITAISGAGNGLIEVVSPAHAYTRLVYTRVSGGSGAGTSFKANFRKVRR